MPLLAGARSRQLEQEVAVAFMRENASQEKSGADPCLPPEALQPLLDFFLPQVRLPDTRVFAWFIVSVVIEFDSFSAT
jgi:hypothetical protein